jgi:RNA polymerase sigma-70 factor (ECF subfamily)
MDEARDTELVRRTLGGDRIAFGGLVGAYQRVLYNVALRMVNDPEDARDLVQTTFLKAYRALHTFDANHRFFSWIYRILINETLNLLHRRRPRVEVPDDLVADDPSPEDRCQANETGEIVRNALMELSPGHREVLVLRHLMHLSHRDMSEAIGVPEKTVKSRLHEARRALGAVLRRRGVGSA